MVAGSPISPRAQKKPQHRQQLLGQQRSSWRWSRILTAAVFTAWAILGVCFLISAWLPHHSADLAQGVQPPAASWRLLSMLGTSNPRHLLEVLLRVCISFLITHALSNVPLFPYVSCQSPLPLCKCKSTRRAVSHANACIDGGHI